ncbi:MAG TPA: hypothetical protein VH439_17335 [Gemmatimonadales bacterium]|jgi:hypothetical protein
MGQTPLLLVDNFFDTVNLYPLATLVGSSEATGREAFRVADYRRERSWWQPTAAAANSGLSVDLGAGVSLAADYVFLDRGHNLWGHSILLQSGVDGVTFPTAVWTRVVPALLAGGAFPVGGDPTTGWSVTEEGAVWTLFTGAAAKRGWNIVFIDNFLPTIPGVMIGARTQMFGFSKVFDEDAGERISPVDVSAAGYRGGSRPYAWRTCLLDLGAIGANDYDTTMRQIRRWLFERNQPWVLCLDYAGHPERAWLFQYDGTTWGFPKSRVLRAGQIKGRELGALLI